MIAKVIDASALAAVAFEEAEAAAVVSRVQGCQLVAPALLRFEMANTCVKKVRREPAAARETILSQHAHSLGLVIHEHDVAMDEVITLAERFKLSAHDASYLWLARALNVELVTLDDRLEKAAAEI